MYYEKEADEKLYYLFRRFEHDGSAAPYVTPPHCHEGCELLVITEGEAEATFNGERRILRAGDILFLSSYDIHSFVFKDCKRYSLVFSKDYCRMLVGDEKTLPSYPLCDGDSFSKITAALDGYYSTYGERIPNGLLVEGLVSYILGIMESCCGRVERRDKSSELMVGVLEYINKNFDADLTLESVSSHFGYSPNYFSSLFNKFVQMNFKNYLSYVRYTHAKELLKRGECNATEAAVKCGFGSMNTFYRAKNKYEKTVKSDTPIVE